MSWRPREVALPSASPRPPAAPGDLAPPGDDDWVAEGFLQVRLASCWERLAAALDRRGGAARALAGSIRSDVLAPLWGAGEWVPGASAFLRVLADGWADGRKAGYDLPRWAEIEARYRDGWTGRAPDATPGRSFDEELTAHLVSSREARPRTAPVPHLPALAALAPPAARRAALWLAEGEAVAAWQRLRREAHDRSGLDERVGGLRDLAAQCDATAAWGAAWTRGSAPLAASLGLAKVQADAIRKITAQLAAAAAELRAFLALEGADPNEEDLRERRRLLEGIDGLMSEAGGDWPPSILANLQADLRALDPARLGAVLTLARPADPAEAVGPAAPEARVRLVASVAAALDTFRLDPAHESWRLLGEAAAGLLREWSASLRIVLDPIGEPGRFELAECLEPGRPPRVLAAAVVLERPGPTRHQATVRRGRAEIAPPLPEAGLYLLRVVQAQADGARPDFAEEARPLLKSMAGHRDLADWWAARGAEAGVDRMRRLLIGLAGLASSPETIAGELASLAFAAFQAEGFDLVPSTGRDRGAGPWGAQVEPRGGTPPARDPWGRFGLKTAGEKVYAPAVRVAIAADRRDDPMVRAVVDAGELLEGLRRADPDWTGWAEYNALVWDVAFRPTEVARAVDGPVARRAFEAVYRRAEKWGEAAPGPQYRALALRLARALRESGAAVVPDLDPATGRPAPLTAPPPDGTTVRWVRSTEPRGQVLPPVRFGVGTAATEIAVSLGPDAPGWWATWLDLPPLPDCGAIARGGEFPLADWYRESRGLPFLRPDKGDALLSAARARFRSWVESPSGRPWFDALARQAAAGPGPARDWLSALATPTDPGAAWCDCAPPIRADGRVEWPRDRSTAEAPLVAWRIDERTPLGGPIDGRFAYAPRLALLEGTFSLGAPGSSKTIQYAEEIAAAAASDGVLYSATGRAVEDLRVLSRDAKMRTPSSGSAPALVAALLKALVGAEGAPASARDDLLAAARRWASYQRIEILPAAWSFARPPAPEQLGGLAAAAEFSRAVEAGRVGLRGFGLSGTDVESSFRAPSLFLSAGPSPPGFAECRTALAAASPPWAREMASELDGWPAAAAEGPDALSFKAMCAFDEFWNRAKDEEPRAVEPAAQALAALLAGPRLGLRTFAPRDTASHPRGHVAVRDRKPNDRGRVVRVVRPGLLRGPGDDDLIYPALVDVE